MWVPMDWLEEWVDVPVPVSELAERFTMAGLEVDSIERIGPDLSAIRVGEVISCESHPNADRLSVCGVDLGDEELATIVCGAPNVAAGQKVAVAQPGVVLPDGTRLKKSKIRGVASAGMICSASELGLSEDHEGILVLDASAAVGDSLDGALGSGTHVLEIAILPNRGDCTSMLGIAREVRAYLGGEIREPSTALQESGGDASDAIGVRVDAPEACHRYDARVVRGIRVGPSPDWLRERIEASGLRSVNCVVDAGNLAMLEFGQPVHVFDHDCIAGQQIHVRFAGAGETIETLDGASRELCEEDLVIADEKHAIAIAGVMGSLDSEVTEKTRDVVIESAHFAPGSIRRTARRLGIASDAAYRFERGVDPQGVQRAADRVAVLLSEVAGGAVAGGIVRAEGAPCERAPGISLNPDFVNRLLGTSLSASEQAAILAKLDIQADVEGTGGLVCVVPSYRNDLRLPEDLAEEIARIRGFDAIPVTEAHSLPGTASRPGSWQVSRQARDSLVGQGLTEVLSFPFLDPEDLDRLALPAEDLRRATVTVLNPVVERDSQLRSTLVPALLHLVHENFNRQAEVVNLFEVARVFQESGDAGLPNERLVVCGVVTQAEEAGLWGRDSAPLFFHAKGLAEGLLAGLGVTARFVGESGEAYLHPGASCGIELDGRIVGGVGELHPSVASAFGIQAPTAVVECDLTAISEGSRAERRYSEVSRHPQVRRDLAVVLDRAQPAGEVLDAIRKQGGAHLVEARVFDRYEGRGVPEGRVSIAFRLVFQRNDRTLTDAEVSKACEKVVRMLAHRFQGELR